MYEIENENVDVDMLQMACQPTKKRKRKELIVQQSAGMQFFSHLHPSHNEIQAALIFFYLFFVFRFNCQLPRQAQIPLFMFLKYPL